MIVCVTVSCLVSYPLDSCLAPPYHSLVLGFLENCKCDLLWQLLWWLQHFLLVRPSTQLTTNNPQPNQPPNPTHHPSPHSPPPSLTSIPILGGNWLSQRRCYWEAFINIVTTWLGVMAALNVYSHPISFLPLPKAYHQHLSPHSQEAKWGGEIYNKTPLAPRLFHQW